MISLKTGKDISAMRAAGKIVTDILEYMKELVTPGVDTLALDEKARELIKKSKAKPAFLGYKVPGVPRPFPGALCVSINEEVVHGIPSREKVLEEGDILSIDVGVLYEGYFGDAAYTYAVGRISEKRSHLLDVTRESLERAIAAARAGNTIGDIGHAVESFAAPKGYGIVRNYAGHGIGKRLHEPPQIPNFGKPGQGVTLKSGMTIAIEPMIMSGGEEVETLPDLWTVVTSDRSDAAHFEKSILVTGEEPEILTPWE
ncbi:MAG: type I methionyl aminopeptidase [Thermovirgaceae bacterium]